VQVYEVATGRPLGAPLHHPHPVHAAAFSRDGKHILTGIGALTEAAGEAWLWEWNNGGKLRAFRGHKGSVRAVALSPDGKLAATGSTDRTARLWEIKTGRMTGLPFPHEMEVAAVAFSPDSNILFTGSRDTGRLWDVATRTPLGQPFTHAWPVRHGVFSPDGRGILIGCPGSAVRWPVPRPVAGDVPRVVLWTEVITGMELDSRGSVRLLSPAAWKDRRRRLEALGGPPSRVKVSVGGDARDGWRGLTSKRRAPC
jgi:WD40 repeat protein